MENSSSTPPASVPVMPQKPPVVSPPMPTAVYPPPKSEKKNGWPLIAFVVFIILWSIAVPAIYYFKIINLDSLFESSRGEEKTIQTKVISTPTTTIIEDSAILAQRRRANSALISSSTTNQYVGKIIEIDKNGVESEDKKTNYNKKIVIKGKGEFPSEFFITEAMLEVIKVSKKENDKEVPISIDDLLVGDDVSIFMSWDLSPESSKFARLIEGKIDKK